MAYDIKEMDIFIDRGANGSPAMGFPKKTTTVLSRAILNAFYFLGLHFSCV